MHWCCLLFTVWLVVSVYCLCFASLLALGLFCYFIMLGLLFGGWVVGYW